ncbi:helix-turn-helix transcriptional regulator, partial [Klebsiella pneumoniae]|nr:helix-turn-helix transcriptional regulator [Klebsiella pneumoniae]
TWRIVDKSIPLRELSQIIGKALMSRPPFGEPKTVTPLLTLREERILEWWSVGMSNEEIARKMGIAVKTVYTYKRNIRMKLGADNRFSLFVPLPEMCVR